MKKKLICMLLLTTLVLPGCNQLLKPGLTHYTKTAEAEAAIKPNEAKEVPARHSPAELSEDFIAKYIDVEDFEAQKTKTVEGIAKTTMNADLAKEEIALWQEIIDSKMLNQYTMEDLNARVEELMSVMDALAKAHDSTMEEYLANNYGMTMDDMKSFVQEQAEKYDTDWEGIPVEE